MNTEIMHQDELPLPANANNSANFLQIIERVAMDPRIDVMKMEKLLEMQERIMTKQAEMSFNKAMTRLQSKLPSITKQGKIEFTDKNGVKRDTPFATYEDIDLAIRPLLIEEGFSLSFNSEWNDGAIIIGTLSHEEGHHRTSSMRLPLDTSGSKNNLQAMGSTLSYGKRYLVGMLLNIVTRGEDDDGKQIGLIDIQQAVNIDLLIKDSGADRARFLALMGVDDVRKISLAKYPEAVNALEAKKKKVSKNVSA